MIVSILRQRIQIDNSYFTISLFKSLNFLKFKSSYIVFVLRFLFVKFAWKVKRESENFFSSFLSSKRLSHMMGTAWLTSFISGVSVCEISVSFFVVFDILRFLLFHLTLIVLMITKVSFLLSLGEALQKWFALWSKLTSNSFDQLGVEGECF